MTSSAPVESLASNSNSNSNSNSDNFEDEGVPTTSTKGNSVVLSLHGKPQFPRYPFRASSQAFQFIASIKAPYFRETQQRAAIDLVCCIDESSSMSGERIELVKKTVAHIIDNLQAIDRFACVGYSTAARVILPFTAMDAFGRQRAQSAAKGINASGSTALCAGLCRSVQLVKNRSPAKANAIASIMMFTDGRANIGPASLMSILGTMHRDPEAGARGSERHQSPVAIQRAPRPIPFMRHQFQRWLVRDVGISLATFVVSEIAIGLLLLVFQLLGYTSITPLFIYCVIVLFCLAMYFSNYLYEQYTVRANQNQVADAPRLKKGIKKATDKGQEAPAKTHFTVNTFGFGADHDAQLLQGIAESERGMYAYIENTEKIGETFAECLGGLVSIVGQNVRIVVEALNDVKIQRCLSLGYETTVLLAGKRVEIAIPDIQSEESRDLLFELDLPAVDCPMESTPIVQLSVRYTNVITDNSDELLSVVTRIARTESDDVMESDATVDTHHNRILAAAAMKDADLIAKKGDLTKARRTLQDAQQLIRESISFKEQFCQDLVSDLDVCVSTLTTQERYRSTGSSTLNSNYASHAWQRCSGSNSYKSQISYISAPKRRMKKKFF